MKKKFKSTSLRAIASAKPKQSRSNLLGDCFVALPSAGLLAMTCFITVFIFFSSLFFCGQAFAQLDLAITSYTYQHNFKANENVTFTVTVRNNGAAIGAPRYFYFSPVLTNLATSAEIYPASSTAVILLGHGESVTLTGTAPWKALPGTYTVTLIIYGSEDGLTESEITRKSGAFPIRVGANPTLESLKVFPTIMDFGVLAYGRHMHPVPLEISTDFFLYNVQREERPWYLRIFTDNWTRYKGIKDSVYTGSPAGFVSSDGRYTIPIRVWCLNYPPEDQEMGWDTTLSGPPPVDDDTYWKGPLFDDGTRNENKAAWLRIPDHSEMTADSGSWRNLVGQDITNTHYVTDLNRSGDFTLSNPFSIYFATETNPTSVKGSYSCNLVLEIYSP